jgi:hypothetical protein
MVLKGIKPILIYIYIYIIAVVVKNLNQIPTHRTAYYYWFFHENGPFFNVFEIPMTDGSLLHKCLKSWWFFINSNNCTTLVQTSDKKHTHTHTHTHLECKFMLEHVDLTTRAFPIIL